MVERINPRGNPASPVWVIVNKPYERCHEKGFLFSGNMGYVFDKIYAEAGFTVEPFVTCLQEKFDFDYDIIGVNDSINKLVSLGEAFKPPIIITLGYDATGHLCPETKGKKKPFKVSLDKYAGSLLKAPKITWPHYVIPTFAPDYIISDWAYRDIQKSIDLGRAFEEFTYWQQHGFLQELPEVNYKFEVAPSYERLSEILSGYLDCYSKGLFQYLSTDIETIRPTRTSLWKNNPGFPYTISFAPSCDTAVSFSLWDYRDFQSVRIWRFLDEILATIPQIGQNYFNFDLHYLEALGFKRICKEKCQDTMINHHILWPELEHKLQFLTKQYTRQPYYKDEGKGWSPKNKTQLMRYNCLDTVVTFKVWEEQQKELIDRGLV